MNINSYKEFTYDELLFYHTLVFNPIDKYPTLLMKSITVGNIQLAEVLIKNKIGIEYKNEYGDNIATLSILYGLDNILELLLDNGVDINTKIYEKENNYHNFITLASKYGQDNIVKLLLKKNIDVNHKSFKNNTALIYAASNNFVNILELLINGGANLNDINDDGYTALMFACKHNCENAALKLIDAGADINLVNIYNENALILASRNGNKNIVNKLLNRSANGFVILPYLFGCLPMGEINAKNEALKNGHKEIADIIKNYKKTNIIELKVMNDCNVEIDGKII